MAGSVLTAASACVKPTVLAVWRNWGNHVHRGGAGASAVRQVVQPWEDPALRKDFFSEGSVPAFGSDLALSPLAPRWLTTLKS